MEGRGPVAFPAQPFALIIGNFAAQQIPIEFRLDDYVVRATLPLGWDREVELPLVVANPGDGADAAKFADISADQRAIAGLVHFQPGWVIPLAATHH